LCVSKRLAGLIILDLFQRPRLSCFLPRSQLSPAPISSLPHWLALGSRLALGGPITLHLQLSAITVVSRPSSRRRVRSPSFIAPLSIIEGVPTLSTTRCSSDHRERHGSAALQTRRSPVIQINKANEFRSSEGWARPAVIRGVAPQQYKQRIEDTPTCPNASTKSYSARREGPH
jgi:hypothetical protein